jgi:hypothetical protein
MNTSVVVKRVHSKCIINPRPRCRRPGTICSASSPQPSPYQQKVNLIKRQIDSSIDRASCVCTEAPDSKACVIALEAVEELTKAYNDLQHHFPEECLDVLEKFCLGQPDDDQCKLFDV